VFALRRHWPTGWHRCAITRTRVTSTA
jgi:hypothetical protein